jgi:hypothetical protein
VDINFNITEELAALCSMKGPITGAILCEKVMRVIEKFNLNLKKATGNHNRCRTIYGRKKERADIINYGRNGETDRVSFTFGIVSLHHISTISLFKGNKN